MLPGIGSFIGGISGTSDPVTLTYRDADESSGNASSYSFLSMGIGTASATRVVIAVIIASAPSGNTATLSSVTIGGTAATIHQSTGNSEFIVGIASVVIVSGTTATVAASFSDTVGRCSAQTYTLEGYNSATPTDSQALADQSGTSISLSSVTVEGGGTAVYGVIVDASVSIGWTTATEDNEDSAFGGENHARAVAHYSPVSTETPTVTASWSSSRDASMVGVSWR